MRVKREQKDLRFVDTLFAFVRPCAANRWAAGRKPECLRRDFSAGEGLQSGLRLKAALDPGRQILIEVIQPIARIGPSSTTFYGCVRPRADRWALDIEWRLTA